MVDETKIKNEGSLEGPYDEYMEEDELNSAEKNEENIDDRETRDAMDYEPDTRMADIINSYSRDGFSESLQNYMFYA